MPRVCSLCPRVCRVRKGSRNVTESALLELYSPVMARFDNRYDEFWARLHARLAVRAQIADMAGVSQLSSFANVLRLVREAEESFGARYDRVLLARPDVLLWRHLDLRTYCADAVYVNNCDPPFHLEGCERVGVSLSHILEKNERKATRYRRERRSSCSSLCPSRDPSLARRVSFPVDHPGLADFHFVMTSRVAENFSSVVDHLDRWRELTPPPHRLGNARNYVERHLGLPLRVDHVVAGRHEEVVRENKLGARLEHYTDCCPCALGCAGHVSAPRHARRRARLEVCARNATRAAEACASIQAEANQSSRLPNLVFGKHAVRDIIKGNDVGTSDRS